jgi:hypothetical protein
MLLSSLRHASHSLVYSLPNGPKRRLLFAYYNHQFPHFGRPVTFNEKINWRILHDRRPLLEWTGDKLATKDRVINAALAELHVPQTIWSGSDVRDLQSIDLPKHWVLKPNHRSGLIHFGTGRPDCAELSNVTATWLDNVQWNQLGEWAYSAARPLLLVEEQLGTPGIPPPDYKFYVFGGEVVFIEMHVNRFSRHQQRQYRPDWTALDVHYGTYELAPAAPPPPKLDRMMTIAEKLGNPFDFIRVDLYYVDGVIEFGELAAYPGSGLDRITPGSFDTELGEKWELPKL